MTDIKPRWADCLYVVIPGVCGSVLEKSSAAGSHIIWGGLDDGFKRALSPSVLAVSDDDGVRAVGAIPDWTILRSLVVVHGYGDLVRSIMITTGLDVDWGHPDRRKPGAQIVVFPWDFRRSVVEAASHLNAQVSERLGFLCGPGTKWDRRVVVIAHSMGGLVAREWASRPEASKWCRGVIALGTPHLGAPKALKLMECGLTLGPIPVARRLSRVVQTWTSAYELLPVYRMIEGDGEVVRPVDLKVGWLDHHRATVAFNVHAATRKRWEELQGGAPTLIPVAGVGKGTLERATLRGESLEYHEGPFGDDDLHGDGTVPRSAAVPFEMNNQRDLAALRPAIGIGHGRLATWEGLARELEQIVLLRPAGVVLGTEDRRLATNLPSAWPAGETLPFDVRSMERTGTTVAAVADDEINAVQVRVSTPNEPGLWMRATRKADRWTIELPPMSDAGVEIELRVSTRSGVDPAPITEAVRIIETSVIQAEDDGEEHL